MLKRILSIATMIATASLISGSALAAQQPTSQNGFRPLSRPIHWNPVPNFNTVVYFKVSAGVYDPGHIFEAASRWQSGLGCFNDPACPTGDMFDHQNTGLLFAKSGATADLVAAIGSTTVKFGSAPLEFGYDLRDGSHCGAGAPRFNVVTNDGVDHFIGCASPAPTSANHGTAWTRMRWGDMSMSIMPPAVPAFLPGNSITSVTLVFDEGTDNGNGYAILDNIEVNGIIVGRQPCIPSKPPC